MTHISMTVLILVLFELSFCNCRNNEERIEDDNFKKFIENFKKIETINGNWTFDPDSYPNFKNEIDLQDVIKYLRPYYKKVDSYTLSTFYAKNVIYKENFIVLLYNEETSAGGGEFRLILSSINYSGDFISDFILSEEVGDGGGIAITSSTISSRKYIFTISEIYESQGRAGSDYELKYIDTTKNIIRNDGLIEEVK